MSQTTTGIRDFKAQLSSYVQLAKAGSVVVITERGQPVARLVPIRRTVEERTEELVEAGLLDWNGQMLEPLVPQATAKGERTVAELLLEDRAWSSTSIPAPSSNDMSQSGVRKPLPMPLQPPD